MAVVRYRGAWLDSLLSLGNCVLGNKVCISLPMLGPLTGYLSVSGEPFHGNSLNRHLETGLLLLLYTLWKLQVSRTQLPDCWKEFSGQHNIYASN